MTSRASRRERIAAEQSQKRIVGDIRAAVTEADNAMDAANTQCLDLVSLHSNSRKKRT